MRKRMFLAVLVVLAGVQAPGWAAPQSEAFNRWLERQWQQTLQRQPVLATSIGDPRYNALLPNTASEAWRAEQRQLLRTSLSELRGFKPEQLEPSEQVSWRMLQRELVSDIRGERFPDWQMPLNQFGGMPSFLAQMGSGGSIQPFRSVRDYEDWLARLRAIPPLFDGMVQDLRLGLKRGVSQPAFIMQKVQAQLAELAVEDPEKSLFWGPLRQFPDGISAADRERLTAAYREVLRNEVLPAYRRLHDAVRDEAVPRARRSTGWSTLPDGKAWYAYMVQQMTTTALGPEVIHQTGLREVARIRAEMEQVRRQVGFVGDLKAFFAHLQDDPRYYATEPEALIEGYRALQRRINTLTPKLFDIAPKSDYEVKPVEAFRAESAAGASYQAGAADGSRPGIFYINTFNLRAQPLFGMETLSLHEASPGHHFQIAIAQEDTALPAFRRFGGGYVAYSEGWALYAESLGKELGLFTDPYQWYGRLSDEMLRAMRLVVDTGLHAKGWSRERAIRYMRDNSSLAESDVVAEVERYLVMPGQALGYKVGELEIRRLRREAEAALGERFDIKAFHRVVLRAGQVPLDVLGVLVREWVRSRR